MSMLPERNIKIWRWIERILYGVFVIVIAGLIWLYFSYDLSWNELYAGLGLIILFFSLLAFTQQKFDSLIDIVSAQSIYLQEDAFQALYGRSPVAYITIGPNGHIVEANPAAAKLLHKTSDSVIDVDFFAFVQSNEEIDSTVLKGKIDAGLTINDQEILLETAEGETKWVLFSAFTLRSDGLRLIALIDITEQKNIDTAKSEFVALATHQLRTPIAAIRWNVELLNKKLNSAGAEDELRYLVKVERNVSKMINLINDFLSVSKLEMGNYASTPTDINTREFFESIEDEFTEKISEKQIQMNSQTIPPGLVIKIDERLFHIIVSNLLSNAVKYTRANGNLTFTYELKGEILEVVVEDDGIGVPADELPKLFTKFYRASNAQSHQTEGTGLGLYIVKQSVEQLGGSISVSSDEDKGARFVVNLPVSVVSDGEIG